MPKTIILLAWLSYGNAGMSFTQEFNSQEACNKAGTELLNTHYPKWREYSSMARGYVCVEK